MAHLQPLADLLRQRLVVRDLGHDAGDLCPEGGFDGGQGGRDGVGVAVLHRIVQQPGDDGRGGGAIGGQISATSSTWFT